MASNSILIQGLIELHLKGEGGQQAVASMQKIMAQAKEVEKSVGGFGTATKKATEGVSALNSAFGSLGRTVAGYFAAGVVANFLRDSYIGFAKTERQALAVENQIRALGQAAEGAGFRGFIAGLANSSGILDDDLIPAMQRAIGAFKDYGVAQEVVTLASKFAAAGIGDVGSNADAIARFFQTGMARSLTQFGINVKGGADATLTLTEGLQALREAAERVGGGFQDAQSQINAMAVVMDNLKDSIGESMGVIGEKILIATNYWKNFVTNVTAGMDAVEGLKQDTLNAQIGVVPPVYGPQATAAQLKFAAEQKIREDKANADKAAAQIEAEQEAANKIRELNQRNDEEIIRTKIELEEEGTQERLRLELELNEMLRAAAVANARAINADVAKVDALFDALARARNRAFNDASGSQPAAGSGGKDPLVEAAQARADAIVKIKEDEAARLQAIQDQETQWAVDSAKTQTDAIIEAGSQTMNALATLFEDHKGFAIGMAIMNTATAIMQIWADPTETNWYVKLAKTIAMAAIGAAQIQTIRNATPDGGGGGAGSSGGVAASPTSARYGPSAPPSAYTGAQGSMSMAPVSGATLDTISGRYGSGSGQTVIVNIRHAWGDKRQMQKLTREVRRTLSNDHSVLR